MTLDTPVAQIAGIGAIFQKKLKKLGIKTVNDLLFHFPHRYEDFSDIIPIAKIKLQQTNCVAGKILEIKTNKTWKRKMFLTQAVVEDETSAIKVIWFNQPYLTRILKAGDNVCLAGKVVFKDNGVYLTNPAYEKISSSAAFGGKKGKGLTHTGRIIPVYPETEGLSSRWLRYIIKSLLINLRNKIPEILPQKILLENKFLPIEQAIWQIHFPESMASCKKAKSRFCFEQLFLIEMAVLRARARLNKERAAPIPLNIELVKKMLKSLAFKLTDAQKKSAWQILKDMEKTMPMNRLLEGDVGSGKTVVALIAVLETVKAGYQAAIMAPTEILAKQHFQEVSSLLKDFNVNIGLLTGKQDKFISRKLKLEVIEISRAKLLEKTKKGELDILIGTHALIQDKVKFGKLGLVILDEQHRFGVEQRAKLMRNKGETEKEHSFIPHLLSMTATPIPRSLALTIYGDLDLSLIDEQPKERKKIITEVVSSGERQKTYEFIRKQVKKGRQAFVLCPRIESGKLSNNGWADVKAVKEEYEKLSQKVFPNLKVEMLHGKMTPKEKEKIMKDFKNKKSDILVSTSVIEVGIDVPNATVMLIEGAERFGLAQLHQFRGRVGRSKFQSYCFLFSESSAIKTRQRLKALISSENGFELSEKDLKIRGPGDFSGTRQWGIPDLIMDSLKDITLVEKTRQSAKDILEQDPELKKYPALRDRLGKFRQKIHLE
jgi:ATP-dependent DNA helicase RecG